MSQTIKLVRVRLGVEYPTVPRPLEIVDLAAGEPKPFPPIALLSGSQKGLVDESHPTYPDYRDRVLALIADNIRDHRMLVLPEFSFCADLEHKTRVLLRSKDVTCIVVGGSYYQQTDSELRIVSPVFVDGQVYYQTKHRPAIAETGFGKFVTYQAREILVFCDTRYGDFAIQICSDALQENFGDKEVHSLRGKIDFLIVVARNLSSALPERLHDLSRQSAGGSCTLTATRQQLIDDPEPTCQSPRQIPSPLGPMGG